MAAAPDDLIKSPEADAPGGGADAVAGVLSGIRLSGAMQFSFVPSGAWQSDNTPILGRMAAERPGLMPFHIVVEGACWVHFDGVTTPLDAGDVLVFPFGQGHQLGSGTGGRVLDPIGDLPPEPWQHLPVMAYGDDGQRTRILCGFLHIGAMDFAPLRSAMPPMMLIRTRGANDSPWMQSMIRQIVTEIDAPRPGGLVMLTRLTELLFVELLRLCILAAEDDLTGWLAALADPRLGRAIAAIHATPARDWTLELLAQAAGLSRTALAAHFHRMLGTSPMRYVRDWRLYLASVELSTGNRPVAGIAFDAGYGGEAAFTRAFSRLYGVPPAAWRQRQRGLPA